MTDSSSSESEGSAPTSSPSKPRTVPYLKRKRDHVEDQPSDDRPDIVIAEEDTPVRSHAQQRKDKKKAKKTHTDRPEQPNEQIANADSATTSELVVKRQNSVWVGNLAFKTTEEQLKTFFADIGEIKRINLPTKPVGGPANQKRGENRGFAYVDFATPEAKRLAITYSEKGLDGRRLLIKDGDDFSGRPIAAAVDGSGDAASRDQGGLTKTAQKIIRSQKQPAAPVLFMGNLGFETTIDSIKDMIAGHHKATQVKEKRPKAGQDGPGEHLEGDESVGDAKVAISSGLKKVRLGTFEDTGKCKGWAFLDFESAQHATAVLINPRNHHLNGRNLVLEYASPDAVRRGGYRSKEEHKTDAKGAPAHSEKSKTPRSSKPERKISAKPPAETQHINAPQEADTPDRPSKRSRKEPEDSADHQKRQRRGPTGGRGGEGMSKHRPKPGAALALAQREKTSIVPSQGKKIVF